MFLLSSKPFTLLLFLTVTLVSVNNVTAEDILDYFLGFFDYYSSEEYDVINVQNGTLNITCTNCTVNIDFNNRTNPSKTLLNTPLTAVADASKTPSTSANSLTTVTNPSPINPPTNVSTTNPSTTQLTAVVSPAAIPSTNSSAATNSTTSSATASSTKENQTTT